MNSDNTQTSDPHRPLVNLSDKIKLQWGDKYIALWNLSIYYAWKRLKSHTKIINLKC